MTAQDSDLEIHRHGQCCGHGHTHGHTHGHAEISAPAPEGGRSFAVAGLDCVEEVAILKRELGPLVGGEERLFFDLLNGRMTLGEAVALSDDAVAAAVARTGMSAERWRPGSDRQDRAREAHHRTQVRLTVLSGLGILAGLALHVWLAGGFEEAIRLFAGHDGSGMPLPEIAAYGLAILAGIRFVLVKAWYAARRGRPDINLLMTVAVAGAIALGEWFEAASVTFLFALSLLLESWSVGRARRAIAGLLDLAPTVARVRRPDGSEAEVAAAEVAVGTPFIVHAGERIPLDGELRSGTSQVNQAPITGESLPVVKAAGDTLFAGTINGDGTLEAVSTRAAEDTTLARIIRLVEQAHSRRAQAEQWVERFARVYTPAVMLLALAVALAPPLLLAGAWGEWFYRALVLLVIACPCALVISTPVSIVAALACSARQGVLVKGGGFMEAPARLGAIAFDKTGTLTQGAPSVIGLAPLDGHSEAELLERAAALEARSTHPLARAILAHAQALDVPVAPAEGVESLPGKGVTGRFRGESFWLGSHRYLLERGQETPEISRHAAELERDGASVVVIGNSRHVCGLIALADAPRPEAPAALQALRAAGVGHLVMLTGDNRVTAEAIAARLGLDGVEAELLPEDKVRAVETLVERYGRVAMVGDGVNDAPAMARASVGIAMGAAGSDAAIETADIALMTDDLSRLPWLVGQARHTLAVIRQNIAFSIAVKAAFVLLTFAGYASLWGAIAADVGASLLVVANALRLLHPGRTNILPARQPVALQATPRRA